MKAASEHRSGKGHKDENFPVASFVIEARHRGLILAFYEFVRIADDIADHATLSPDEKLAQLDRLEAELLGSGDGQPEALRLRAALTARGMSAQHPCDVLTAFRMDVTKLRYADWNELIHSTDCTNLGSSHGSESTTMTVERPDVNQKPFHSIVTSGKSVFPPTIFIKTS